MPEIPQELRDTINKLIAEKNKTIDHYKTVAEYQTNKITTLKEEIRELQKPWYKKLFS